MVLKRFRESEKVKYFQFLIVTLCCSLDFMSLAAMVTVSADIQRRFNLGHTVATWGLTAYAITFAGFIAFFGRLGDITGNANLLTASSFGFSFCSLMCAVIPSFEAFAAFRALQGICGAGTLSSGYALVPELFAGPEVQRYFSLLATISSAFFGVGLIIGGAFSETESGYKGLFYVFFALMFLLTVLSYVTFLPNSTDCNNSTTRAEKWRQIKQLDYIGIFLFITASILLVVGLTEGGISWKHPTAYVILPVSLVLLGIFVLWNMSYKRFVTIVERYGSARSHNYVKDVQVLIPGELTKVHNFTPVMIAVFMIYASFICLFYVIEQYGELVDGLSPLQSGVRTLPLGGSLILIDSVVVVKYDLFKPKIALMIGSMLALIGAIIFVQLKHVHTNVYVKILLPAQILTGGGTDLCFCYVVSMVIGYAPEDLRGIASGVLQSFGQFGSELTLSIMASILGNVVEHGDVNDRKKSRDRLLNVGYYLLGILIIEVLVIVLFVRDRVVPSDEEKEASIDSEGSMYKQSEQKNTSRS